MRVTKVSNGIVDSTQTDISVYFSSLMCRQEYNPLIINTLKRSIHIHQNVFCWYILSIIIMIQKTTEWLRLLERLKLNVQNKISFSMPWRCNAEDDGMRKKKEEKKSYGLVRDSNPGPLAPKARIMPLDQQATYDRVAP